MGITMKFYKLMILSSLLFLLSSCDHFAQKKFVTITIDEDANTVFVKTSGPHLETSVGTTITGKYTIIPDNNVFAEIIYLKSLDNSIIEITDIDVFNKTFKGIVKKQGSTKIVILTKEYSSSTSLIIYVI